MNNTLWTQLQRRNIGIALLFVFIMLVSGSITNALTVNTVTPSWTNAVGSSGPATCVTPVTVGAEAQIRYGDNDFNPGCPADPNLQSGFGFEGNTGVTFANGQPFVLGELTHYNNPIFASSLLNSVDLSLSVDLGDPVYTTSLLTTVTLDETANSLATCPYASATPCSDRIGIARQTIPFTVGGVDYQLETLGLIPGTLGSCTYNATQINNSYISNENAANSACLFGRVTLIEEAELVIEKQANVVQASPGDVIDYQIDYNCFSTTTFCTAPVLTDFLPDEVIYTGSTGSTHTISATGVYSSGNHSVSFQFIDPLPAGSTGYIRIRVRVRDDGTVGNGESIDNLAVSIIGNGPTSNATNSIPAVAVSNWDVVKTAPAIVYLDTDSPSTDTVYTVAICSNSSTVNLLGAQMVDTLPTGAVFVSASNAGVYDAGPPGTVTWDMGDLAASSGCTNRTVVVQYPEPTFSPAQNVVNTVDGTGTIVGGTPWTDSASVTNPLVRLIPNPSVSMNKSPGRSGYVIGSTALFLLAPQNTGNVSLDVFTVTDTLPTQINLTSITVGDFAPYAGSIIVRYERSDTPGVWSVWPGGPFPDDNRTLNVSALGLPGGVYITKVQWDFGTVNPGFAAVNPGTRLRLYGTVISPDHSGNPVTVGDVITNTAVLDWQYIPSTGGPGTGGSSTGSASITVDAIPVPEFDKTSAGGISAAWRFLIGQQVGYYVLNFNNSAGIAVDAFTITDTIPAQYNVTAVTVGRYDNFSGTVTVRYERSDNPGVWNTWTGSPFTPTNQTLNVSALSLPGGVAITGVQWQYGTIGSNFAPRGGEAPLIYGQVINPDRNGSPVADGDTMSNGAELSWTYEGVPSQTPDTQNDDVRQPIAYPSAQKTTTTSGPYIPSSLVIYSLRVGAASSSPSALINPIVMELLPTNLLYVAGTWVYNAGSTGVAAPAFEQIANYNSTGRTLLRWRFTGSFAQNQFATITFNSTVTAGTSTGTLTNEYYVTSDDVPTNGTVSDVNDLDDDGLTTDLLTGNSTTIPVDELVGLDSFKGVRGELDSAFSVYPNHGFTIPNGRVDYRLTIINRGNIPINNVKVVDILPFVGDTGVQDVRPRNSAWRPVLTGAVSAPAGVTVYYSTAQNPCRPQIIPSGPAGCTAPNWSLLPPADVTTVYSLRFDFTTTLAPGQSFNFNWTMKAPANAVDGTIAWNSFAYTSTNANSGVPLRPAEPNKVGIEMERPLVAPLIDLVKSTNGFDANLPTGPLIPITTPVTWTYLITNTGNTRLANITLTDDIISSLVCAEGAIPPLDAGDTFTCTVTGTAILDQYANIGTVSGQPVDASDQPLTDINGVNLPNVTDTDPSHYFGYNPALVRLGDYVWIDNDNDGVQDVGEPGLPGITVNLYQDGNPTAIRTTLTDGNGLYTFANLSPDDYFVEFVIPNTYTLTFQNQGGDDTLDSDADQSTGRTIVTTLDPGENDPTWDAGVRPSASIGDFVWRDIDADNIQDTTEPGVAGVQVDLLNSVSAVIATTFTDADGLYSFTDLIPGDYAIHFTLPSGYMFSLQDIGGNDALDSDVDLITGRTINTTLLPGENDPNWDAGLVQPASIGNFVWRDNDNDGQQDAGEPGVSGITVNLLDSGGTIIGTDTTDASGNYLFNNLRPGTYAIEVVLPASGFIFSPRDQGSNTSDSDVDTITGRTINTALSPNENDLTWDAGIVPLASIGDRVWNDANNNGVQDGGESGFNNVTVNLLNSSGTIIGTDTTDASGNYLFENLVPATYSIEVVRPTGYVFSPRDTGGNDAADSDVNRTDGHTVTTVLSPGENDLTWDAGLVQDASIGNYVWSDLNDDGVQDGGEPGVSGVTVNLRDSGGSTIATTTTDGSGFYLFDFLTPADYSIEFIAPADYAMARRDLGGNDATDSDPDRFTGRTTNTTLSPGEDDLTWDAGIVLAASIGNFVWDDANDNGIQDGGETGVSGVTVRLLNSANAVVATTTTDGSGIYGFASLPPDDYRIEVVLPTGYVFSQVDQGGNDAADSDVNITSGRAPITTLAPDEDDLTWDAGLVPAASIGNFVWRDNNNNGIQDGGEPGVDGVTVRLLDSGGATLATTTTAGGGLYSFTNLRPGDYAVEFVLPTGFQRSVQDQGGNDATDSDADTTSGRTIVTTLAPGENDPTWDAGIVPLAAISNFVWRDNNNNGRQDGGEPGVNAVTVRLLDSGGATIATTTTAGGGFYSFTNLPPADYAIEFVLPAGYQFSPRDAVIATDATDSDADTTTGRTINTTLSPGESDTSWDGGLVPLTSIGNFVWNDTNGNGQQNGGELGINNVTVNLLNSSGTVINTTTTNASGNYSFINLPPGTYAIEFVLPGGYIYTTLDSGADSSDSDANRTTGRTINTVLSPGENDLTWDAGIVQPASLGNYVWLDANDDGIQDGSELGVSNVTVRLLDSGGTLITTTTTDATGAYLFNNLLPGTYAVEFVPPAGYVIARLDLGGNDALDSDANRSTGRTINTTLIPGENDLTWDAGLLQVASIGDRVWIDGNNNGIQDGGESGFSGATVRLLDSSNATVSTTTTDGSGNYLFSNLVPGDYRIEVVLPTNYVFSQADQGGDTADSDVNITTGRTILTTLSSNENDLTWDAGLVPAASIGDRVWVDNNDNGVQDGGELGIDGVTVRLLDSGGTTVATTTTAGGGLYSFTNLRPGDYAVEFALPAGYERSVLDAAAATDATDSDADLTTGRTINTTLIPGENDLTWDAGVVPLTSIGDRVWVDTNDNGILDGVESGLSNVTVNLLNSSGTVINTTTTDGTGNYIFSNLSPSIYAIEFVPPTGYVIAKLDQGANDAIDSDADQTSGRTINTTLDPSEVDLTWDMGLVQVASIGNYVWTDTNGNGQQDGGEAGVDGVTVRLLDSIGATISSTTTAGGGLYSFTNLRPGTYAVQVVLPGGYIFTTRDFGADVTDSDADRTSGTMINTVLDPAENDLTWDAGIVQPASLGNYVWLDTNDNGVQDGGTETGVNNVTVRLLDGSGTVISTTTTSPTGAYLFDNLIPGTYAVEIVPPSGYVIARLDQGGDDALDSDANRASRRMINTTLIPGENDLTWDAGLLQVASIGDRVWIDINNNGVQDLGENNLAGVTVNLLDSVGATLATTTTDGSGNYLFNNLVPGDYAIQVVLPAGYQFSAQDQGADDAADSDVDLTTGLTITTTLSSDEHDMTWDAGVVPLASIGDRVWIDANNNGVLDGEVGLSGVTVNLLNSVGAFVATTTTNGTGNYLFSNLPPADYAIEFILPAGYQFSPRDAAAATDATDSDADISSGRTINTTLAPGENDMTWDAGVVALTTIGNFVWRDNNDNGIQDIGEPGVDGVTVRLLNGTGSTTIATTITAGGGLYSFTNLPPGDYIIEFVTPAGFVISQIDQGGDDTTDSDASLTSGRTISTTLIPGETDMTWDMGLVPVASIGDRVWIDINNNGVQDGGEANLAGVIVSLLDAGGAVIGTDTTDGTGNYLFDNLRPGTYGILITRPAGYQFSVQDQGADDAADSDVNISTGRMVNTVLTPTENDLTWDAGVVPLVSIGNFVWRDNDNDGVQDGGEPGISGITVNLLDNGGAVINTTTTDANGLYSFTNLPPGNYAIRVVLPVGFQFSPQDAVAATDTTDSDININTGRTVTTTLDPDEDDMTWDAGLVPLVSIGNFVWSDNDLDGVQDAGEPGISGVTVNLLNSSGTIIGSTVTNSSGLYSFTNLPPGNYAIQVVLPPLHQFSPQDQGADDAVDSDANISTGIMVTTTLIPGENDLTWDAGLIPLGSIGDTVWLDSNHNGVLDGSEVGIPNVTVTIEWPDGTIQTDVTDANGEFLFENLPPGVYIVTVDTTTLPPGLEQTADPDGVLDSTTVVNLDPGENDLSLEFGYAKPIPAVAAINPTPTPFLVDGTTTPETTRGPWSPITACERTCVDWQLYHTNETGDWEIFRLGNLSDRSAVSPNLSQGEGFDDMAPTRSPNAEWIVFSSNRDGNWELYVAPTDGDSSKTQRVTHNNTAIDTDPVWGPNNYVVYESTRDGNWELYMVDMTTGVQTRLTDNPGNDVNAFWSPDGAKLLFQSDRGGKWQIYEIDLRNGSITRLSDGTADDLDPQYNNAGDQIAFRSYRDGDNSVIYSMNAVGSDITRISDAAGDATSHAYSPDDSLIAYQSDLDGDLDIYVYENGTQQTRQMTDNDVPDYAPTWLCNTSQVIFTSEASGNPDIFEQAALPINAPAVDILTDAEQLTFDEADDVYPENSPTEENSSREGRLPGAEAILGEQTSFLQPDVSLTEPDVSTETGEVWESVNSCAVVCPAWSLYHTDRTGDWEIFRLDDGGDEANSLNLSQGLGANDSGPTRAPNAKWIAFTSDRDGNAEVYVASSEGGDYQRVTYNGATDTDPAWSPDSQHIVFESDRDGNWNLYMVDVQTGVETQLTDDPADDRNASWSSAGGSIAFQSNRAGIWQIYVYDRTTGSVTRLQTEQEASNPVFGNGGSSIAFNLLGDDDRTEIAVMQQDGSGLQVVSDPAGSAQNPTWYFDDTLLAYQSDLDGDLDIYVYDFASGSTRTLTDNSVADYAPTWQCGEPEVTFTSEVSGNADIFRTPALPIDASPIEVDVDAEQLTNNESSDRFPVGAPTEENASRED